MAFSFRKILQGLNLVPKTTTTSSDQGDLEVLDSDGKLRYHNGTTNSPVVTEAHSATLTNKTIDADANTITNIENADIKAGANIARNKLASGTANRVIVNDGSGVLSDAAAITADRALISDANGIPTHSVTTATELSYVNGVTSSIQTQLDSKASQASLDAHINDTTDAHDASAISNVPSGNLAATDVQGALNELQSDIDTRALDSDLTTHIADTTTHGTTGNIVGTSDTQTLSNKTFSDATTHAQISTPSNPSAGFDKLYFKSDDNLYKLTSGGIESQIGRSGIVENAQTGTSYTFVLTDQDKLVSFANSGLVTVTVPANASVAFPIGTVIQVISAGTGVVEFVGAGGVTLNSLNGFLRLEGQYAAATLVKTATNSWYFYGQLVDASFITATGGTITTDGDYKVHTFTSSGTFTIVSGSGLLERLVVAGAGGGGGAYGGGGGAGGLLSGSTSYGVGAYTVTIGAGGPGGAANAYGTNGSNSVFDIFTATGGGAGAGSLSGAVPGNNGGSGGGGGQGPGAGGTGTVGQGNNGGAGANLAAGQLGGGGGGGAGAVGGDAPNGGTSGGNGGNGSANSITGTSVTYAGGGGGGAGIAQTGGTAGTGGAGAGGGQGVAGGNGGANTGGGGGGGGGSAAGGAGGSGIVILRYKFQ